MNIENNVGIGSIRQIVSDNDAKNPIAYGLGAVAFGGFRGDKPNNTPTDLPGMGDPSQKESNISGIGESTTDIGNIRNIVEDGRYYKVGTKYNFKNIISDTTTYVEGIQATAIGAANRVYGNWSFAGGKDNVVIGKSGFAFGNGNVVSAPNYKNGDYAFTAVFGSSNISTGSHSLVSGENNTNTGNWSIVAGKGIKNEGKFSAVFGGGDTSGAVPSNIRNVGQGNLLAGYSLNSHSSQFDVDCNYVSLLGRTLTATNSCQTIVGRNSSFAVKGTDNLRFAVGTGWYKHKTTGDKISTSAFDKLSDTDKANYEVVGQNGFEIYEDGELRSYTDTFRIGSIIGSKYVSGGTEDDPIYTKTVSINKTLLVSKPSSAIYDSGISILSMISGWYSPIYDSKTDSFTRGKKAFEIELPSDVDEEGELDIGGVRSYFEPKGDFDIIRKIDLDNEKSARSQADSNLGGRIDTLSNNLTAEAGLRSQADTELNTRIDELNNELDNRLYMMQNNIDAKMNKTAFIYENGVLTIIID